MNDSTENSNTNTLHIYTRVSTLQQEDQGTSLDSQRELGIKRANDLGFAYKLWNEGGRSSDHEDISERPVLFALYKAIQNGEVKHLWIYDQSRLSRKDNVASVFRYECNKQGVTIYTKDGKFDLTNPTDMLLKQLLDAVAEFDNVTRAERTRIGKLRRVKEGCWQGGTVPFGYLKSNHKLEINEEEAKWVRQIYKMYYEGKSTIEIKKILDAKGVKPRREKGFWTLGSLQKILRNTYYIGYYKYLDNKTGESIEVQCPSLIDITLWNAVRKRCERFLERKGQINRTTHFYLLRDFMYCGHCGTPIGGRINEEKDEYLYYCPKKERKWVKNAGSEKKYDRSCSCELKRSLNIKLTDQLVWNTVLKIHSESSILREEVKNYILAKKNATENEIKAEIKRLQKREKQLYKEINQLKDMYANIETERLMKRIDKDLYSRVKKNIESEKIKLMTELEQTRTEIREQSTAHRFIDWYRQYGEDVAKLNSLTDAEKKKYLEGMIERIDVRYEPALRQHELMIHFIRPLVGDSINKYVNGNKKKYTIQNGTKDILVQVKKNLRLHAAKLDIKSGEIDITNCKHEVIDPTSKLQRDGGVVTQVHNPIVLRI